MQGKDVFVYIDVANMWGVYKSKGKIIEYEKFAKYVRKKYPMARKIHFYYYEAYPATDTRKYNTAGKHNFHAYLRKRLGFVVKKKKLKILKSTDDFGHTIKREKGNMDVEIATDMVMHNCNTKNVVILCSGDSDFASVVNTLKGRGVAVMAWSGKNSISWELRTAVDAYIDLLEVSEIWGNDLRHRGR